MTGAEGERALREALARCAALERETAALRARLAAQERAAAIEPILSSDLGLGLRRAEARILLALLARSPRVTPALALAGGWRGGSGPKRATLHVHICRLRRRLAQIGVAIEHVSAAGGYRIDAAGAARLREMASGGVEEDEEDEGPAEGAPVLAAPIANEEPPPRAPAPAPNPARPAGPARRDEPDLERVIEERRRRARRGRSAVPLGEPGPGRSALDARGPGESR